MARSEDEVVFRVGPLVNLPALLESLGCDPAPLFRSCGVDMADLSHPDRPLPFVKLSQLIRHCTHATRAEHLGLLLGQECTASHIGLPAFLLASAPTVETGLHALQDNFDLHDRGGILSLEFGTSHTTLGYSLLLPGTEATAQIYDLSAVMMYQVMRKLCGKEWAADSVSLARRKPRDATPYQKFFRTSMYFDASECSITFSNRWLSLVPPSADPLLFNHLSQEALALHHQRSNDIMEALPGVMRSVLLSREHSAIQVASTLGIHERTLHRRLKAANTNFRDELDKARKAMSEELLGGTDLPVCDIASTLGYADSSGFIRAFQRWCDTSPTAWREAHAGGGNATHRRLNGGTRG